MFSGGAGCWLPGLAAHGITKSREGAIHSPEKKGKSSWADTSDDGLTPHYRS